MTGASRRSVIFPSLSILIGLVVGSCLSPPASAQQEVAAPHTPPVLMQMIRDDSIHRELSFWFSATGYAQQQAGQQTPNDT